MSSVQAPGSREVVRIERDAHGIPSITAESARDAWFGLGYAAAEDRMWQMEYDRRRAAGRWAEVVGRAAVTGDSLARRLRLRESAGADLAAMSGPARDSFVAYAEGVNAVLNAGGPLPPEYLLTGIRPEPWEPWHSIAAFKIRHVLMSTWQVKLVNATVLALSGAEAFRRLETGVAPGTLVTLPPGGRTSQLYLAAAGDLSLAAKELGFLAEVEAGSNAWAVSAERSASGFPVICNDSHRALDCPNAYWQARLRCPEFDVAGATFPGLPGFPHFGQTGTLAWAITNTGADVQDLYIEQFRPAGEGLEHRTADGWAPAGRRSEEILVAGADAIEIETWTTANGSVVHGEPRKGRALSLRWTATVEPCLGFEVLQPMLSTTSVEELFASQRQWADPVNNLVAADVGGSFGYLLRGKLPIRASSAARHAPVPGWEAEHAWNGWVDWDRMPSGINPEAGYVVTSNQAVLEGDEPYIATVFADTARCERITELLASRGVHTTDQLAAIQADVTSLPARRWVERLARMADVEGESERARAMLAGWDGRLSRDAAAPLLYSCFRRELSDALLKPVLGQRVWDWLLKSGMPPVDKLVRRWTESILREELDGIEAEITKALGLAWRAATTLAGPDPRAWRYGDHHHARPRHPLAAMVDGAGAGGWSPASVEMDGDADTVQAAAYSPGPGAPFTVTNLSVFRQVVDMAEPGSGTWVIPGGASGNPESPHFADQLPVWGEHRRIPIRN